MPQPSTPSSSAGSKTFPPNISPRFVFALIAALTAGVFALDLATPLGMADWLLYIPILFLAARFLPNHYLIPLMTAFTVLTVAGSFLSPPGGQVQVGAFNRVVGVAVLWATAFLLLHRTKTEEALRKAHQELEQRVEDRTTELRRTVVRLEEEITARKLAEAERARLLEQVQASHERLQALSRQLIDAQEEERGRIARELHDETGQALTSVLVGLRAIEDLHSVKTVRTWAQELREIVGRSLRDLQRMAHGLRPSILNDLGLEQALKQLASECTNTCQLSVDLHVSGLGARRMSAPFETAIYRIAQEAVTNAAKHAQAKNVSILLTFTESDVKLIIEDNGRGFGGDETRTMPGRSNGLGLLGMQERAALLNGSLTIESVPGKGTGIYVHLPIPERTS